MISKGRFIHRLRASVALHLLLWPLAAPAQAPAPAPASTVLARGVEYRHLQTKTPAGEPWSIHVLEVSRKEKSIELRAVPGRSENGAMQRELPTAMANRVAASGEAVLAVVNGDYDLPTPYLGVSDGLSITSGQVWTTGKPSWPNFALLKNGEPVLAVPEVNIELTVGRRRVPVGALNKPFGTAWGEGGRAYTRQFRPAIQGQTPFDAAVIRVAPSPVSLKVDSTMRGVVREVQRGVREVAFAADAVIVACRPEQSATADSYCGLRVGDKVKLRIRVRMSGRKGVHHAIGGFPILVEKGRRSIVGTPGENLKRRHPRTAVCTNERKIIFVVVDGRQPQLSVGMTLEELADLMVSLGCTTAMNTDGGGSSVMAVAPPVGAQHAVPAPLRIVNSPSDGQERGRGNAWVILKRK
jgi:hypothetical protein